MNEREWLDRTDIWFDRAGNGITFWRFLELKEDRAYTQVREDWRHGYRVHTAWLGEDPQGPRPGGGCPPMIFETMIFRSDGSVLRYQRRHATEAEAVQGHSAALGWLEKRLESGDVPLL